MNNLLTQWSRLLICSLADVGIVDVVVSPGSRSTPLIVAACREPRVRCHSVIDERTAGFVALGQARVTGRASALLCTSGTALAHYFPAVIEASLCDVPMLIISADRPHEMQHCSGAQTIDQVKIFGDYVRRFYDIASPDHEPSAFIGARRMIAQGAADTLGSHPGPVHVNVRARKPLEPVESSIPAEVELERLVTSLLARALPPATRSSVHPAQQAVAIARDLLVTHPNGIIACGPAGVQQREDMDAICTLSRVSGYPVYVEATSQLRFSAWPADVARIEYLDLILRRRDPALAPKVIVQIGAPPTLELISKSEACGVVPELIVVGPSGWADPSGRATARVLGDISPSLNALSSALGRESTSNTQFGESLQIANVVARQLVESHLTTSNFSEGQAVACVVEAIPDGGVLVIGNSLAVREVDQYCNASQRSLRVVHQRGASGIDGNVALAIGAAQASGAPTVLLFGDVSFLHDVGSLVTAKSMAPSLVIVVLQNCGGRIFEQLPLAQVPGLSPDVMKLVTTPHTLNFAAAAAFAGASYVKVESDAQMRMALGESVGCSGVCVIEVLLEPHGAHAQNAELWRRAADV